MREAQQVRIRAQVQDLGRVQQVGDGVARVEGLSEAMLDEVVLFSNGI
jgi:F0F1-type ATP synthase alpha subunit